MSLYDHPDLFDELLPVDPSCVRFYADLAREHGGPVLELGCGTGQLTRAIATLGIPIAGIDTAPSMIEAAKRRCVGLDAEIVAADMRDFDLGRRFSLIFAARNSLLHLETNEDLEACFAAVRRNLADGGAFAFDVFNPSPALLARRSGERYRVMPGVEETADYDAATQVSRNTWLVSHRGQEHAFPLHLRNLFPQELRLLVRHCGFRIDRLSGDWDGAPFSSRSARQVVVCRADLPQNVAP